jgi:hypothetical protein
LYCLVHTRAQFSHRGEVRPQMTYTCDEILNMRQEESELTISLRCEHGHRRR